MKKGDWLLLAACLLLGGLGFLLASLIPSEAPPTGEELLYVRVQSDEQTVALIPLDHEASYLIQTADGGENQLHVTRDSIRMESANCHNQLCVLQGTVTLANSGYRPLNALIVCAPHKVVCELLTARQAAELSIPSDTGAVTETVPPSDPGTVTVTAVPADTGAGTETAVPADTGAVTVTAAPDETAASAPTDAPEAGA